MTMHHIVCDGWSIELIRRELPRLLPGAGTEPARPSATYFDFVRWQRALLAGPEGARLCDFWREELSGGQLPKLDLPADRPRPSVPTYRGGSCPLPFPPSLAARLRTLAREEGGTLFPVLLAGFFAWLHRATGQVELVVGTPTAGRDRVEFMDVIGYFVDPVAVRVRIDPDRGFRELLRRVRTAAMRALEHRDLPFGLLVEKLRPGRDPARSPIFDVLFNFLSPGEAASGDRPEPFDGPQADGKFDLTLTILDQGDALAGSLGYSADLFDEATARRFAGQLAAMLEQVSAEPDPPLGTGLRPEMNPEGLVPVLSGRPLDDPDALRPVHERFELRAAATPDRIAVVAGERRLTYGELNGLANGLAR